MYGLEEYPIEANEEDYRLYDELTQTLRRLYPTEYAYHAPYVMWRKALTDGLISEQEYNLGREVAGSLWNYVGD